MKRTSAVCLLIVVLGATLVAPADASTEYPSKVTRRATKAYENPALGLASGTGGSACLPCPAFLVFANDNFVKMEVQDVASPAPVAFGIQQLKTNGRCCDEVAGPFCGTTGNQPVAIKPGLEVFVFVYAFGDVTCPGAFGTTGTVSAVFSNTP